MAGIDNKYSDLALLILRIGVGVIFIVSGWGKLTGIEGVQGFFGNAGIPLPGIMAWVVALIEFFGGMMVVFGAYAKIPYLLLAIIMLVAIFMVKIDQGFGASRLELMLLLTCFALFLTGSGQYSVDYKIATR